MSENLEKAEKLRAKADWAETDERNPILAFELYGKAAVLGDVIAFREVVRFGEDCTCIQDMMVDKLEDMTRSQDPVKVSEGIDIARGLSHISAADMSDEDVAKLFDVANRFDILQECIDELHDIMIDSQESLGDSGWMYPNGHDDGE